MRISLALVLSLVVAGVVGACGDAGTTATSSGQGGSGATDGGAGGVGGAGGEGFTGSSSSAGGGIADGFVVTPEAPQVISVNAGDTMPTVGFSSWLDGAPVGAGWGVDRGEVGVVVEGPAPTTTFTPSGKVGGLVTVFAGLNDEILERQVMVELSASQNGPGSSPEEQAQIATDLPSLTAGGGIGGVGGEGLGIAVTNGATLTALDNPSQTGQAESLRLLYPYDGTIWPRGLLAPLLQWDWSLGDVDAVKIELVTKSGSFRYAGTFGRPAILSQTGGTFRRHPVPQGAWTMATNSAGGKTLDNQPDTVELRLTIAKNGVGYGPLVQTWRVAPARLAGTIYYQSYGTQLAKNYPGAVGGDHMFGGAVLGIKVGDTAPQLVAGQNGGSSACRVCHSVAADGSRLIAQHGDSTSVSSGYTITQQGVTEQPLATSAVFPAITPDGAYALNAAGQMVDLNNGGAASTPTGLSVVSTNLGTPAFAPAGDRVVFNPMAGPGITNPAQKLVVMSFDPLTHVFASPVEIVDNTGSPAETRPGWPAFFPDGQAVVYQQQIAAGVDGNGLGDLRTRKGAKAYLAWADTTGTSPATPLAKANGDGYLPQLAQPIAMTCTGDGAQVGGIDPDHGDDVNLNYEPTMNPVASGGYAWVVFTSRRMYGSVADIPPFCSDPRGVDLIQNITPKKLWVAAIDLNAPAGTDPSHPAFYLPAQELLAGNARAFWVLEPCRMDGEGCETGDQCCNGFCSSTGMGDDALECTPVPSGECSKPQEACTTGADCCDMTNLCINGFCAPVTPE
ncbi:MAG: hypothetical protein R3B72_41705 [Polyangiaceae bacterium]